MSIDYSKPPPLPQPEKWLSTHIVQIGAFLMFVAVVLWLVT